jgi:acyl-CoA thioester hydrolase
MYIHEIKVRIRYGEVDQMGYMYYGNYCLYYEIARAEMIRDFGYTYAALEHDGIVMPVVKVQSKYLRPAHYDELITIKTTIKSIDQLPFLTFFHDFYNEHNHLLHKGEVTLIFFDPKTQKKTMPNESMMNILKQHF